MAVLHTESVPSLTQYVPDAGSFAPSGMSWYSCRETFHKHYFTNNKTAFFYSVCNNQSIDEVIKVITEGEEKLNIIKGDRIQLWPVNLYDGVFCIEPGQWWIDPIRFTLLTALLREGKNSIAESFANSKVLWGYLYKTRAAVKWFFEGNTFYQNEIFDGWVATFEIFDGWFATFAGGVNNLLGNTPSKHKTVKCCHHIGWQQYDLPLVKR